MAEAFSGLELQFVISLGVFKLEQAAERIELAARC